MPLYKCFVSEGWEETKLVTVIVARKHVNGNITAGLYMVDLFCLGFKGSVYLFNEDEEILMQYVNNDHNVFMKEIDYNLAHNIVYASLKFAEEVGFKPCREWAVSKYILEEDNDNIPFIDIECGKDGGKPVVLRTQKCQSGPDCGAEKKVGVGNFIVLDEPDNLWYEVDDEDEDEEDCWGIETEEKKRFMDDLLKQYPDFKEIYDWELHDYEAFLRNEKDVPEFQAFVAIQLLFIKLKPENNYELNKTPEYEYYN